MSTVRPGSGTRAVDGRIDGGGSALFYTMSGLFFALFMFVLWYCPRHL